MGDHVVVLIFGVAAAQIAWTEPWVLEGVEVKRETNLAKPGIFRIDVEAGELGIDLFDQLDKLLF